MHLLDTTTLELKEFIGDDHLPSYAILSHTWGDDEVSFQDICKDGFQQKQGFQKIKFCCDQALKDGLKWAWVDTCCIDKSSSAELSEAINSMYRWYQNSEKCYVYLVDVPKEVDLSSRHSAFSGSKWFTRGWTLQELIASPYLYFYSKCWTYLGRKDEMCDLISEITGIELEALQGSELETFSVAKKMSWAAKRETTRSEDIAYCLLGIFDVNMPLIYGEGKKAFIRLQEEIIKSTSDHSIFAWGMADDVGNSNEFYRNPSYQWLKSNNEEPADDIMRTDESEPFSSEPSYLYRGLLADSPAEFVNCGNIIHLRSWLGYDLAPITVTHGCVRIEIPLVKNPHVYEDFASSFEAAKNPNYSVAEVCIKEDAVYFAVLGCRIENNYEDYLALPLKAWDKLHFGRIGVPVLVSAASPYIYPRLQIHLSAKTLRVKPEKIVPLKQNKAFVLRTLPDNRFGYRLVKIECSPPGQFHTRTHTITTDGSINGPQAILFFRNSESNHEFAVMLGRKPNQMESFVAWVKVYLVRPENADGVRSRDIAVTKDQLISLLQNKENIQQAGSGLENSANLICSTQFGQYRFFADVQRGIWDDDASKFSDWVSVTIYRGHFE